MQNAVDVLRYVRGKVAAGGDLVSALDAAAIAGDAAYSAALDALYKAIPIFWRLRHGSWSSQAVLRRIDVRNYRLWLDSSDRLRFVDRALARLGAEPVEICGRGGND